MALSCVSSSRSFFSDRAAQSWNVSPTFHVPVQLQEELLRQQARAVQARVVQLVEHETETASQP
eukprot:765022-Pyramimonas_sp.AAC.1